MQKTAKRRDIYVHIYVYIFDFYISITFTKRLLAHVVQSGVQYSTNEAFICRLERVSMKVDKFRYKMIHDAVVIQHYSK